MSQDIKEQPILKSSDIPTLHDLLRLPTNKIQLRFIETYFKNSSEFNTARRKAEYVDRAIKDVSTISESIQRSLHQFNPELVLSSFFTNDEIALLIAQQRWDENLAQVQDHERTTMMDAIAISIEMGKVTEVDMQLPKKIVDLGSGSGLTLAVFAKLGYEVYGIDQDSFLVKQAKLNYKDLHEGGYPIASSQIRLHTGKFYQSKDKNSDEINFILSEADIFFCYPWPREVNERLELFKNIAKPSAVLILYGNGEFCSVDERQFQKYRLKPVIPTGQENWGIRLPNFS